MSAEPSSWDIASGYVDAHGRRQTIDPTTVETIGRSLLPDGAGDDRRLRVVALRSDGPRQISLADGAGELCWEIRDNGRAIASGITDASTIALPTDLPVGSYILQVDTASTGGRTILVLVAPPVAYQPPLFCEGVRAWLLVAQLYAVRSPRNWGHGDFTDLTRLLTIAAQAGAAGVGLNPLHALAPGEASGYSPSSRLFLNSLYIDVEAIAEFPGLDACGLNEEVARLRALDVIDYPAVHRVKLQALRAAYDAFRDHACSQRHGDFNDFRQRHGESLDRFATFETLHQRFGTPWQAWPTEWQNASRALARFRADGEGDAGFYAFIQWVADEQLGACARRAKDLALPVGLYLDVAVGVDAGGADVWSAPDMLPQTLSIGAPPDVFNPGGQNWGLALLHPQALIDSDFSLFRQTLRSVMRHAGAIRIDHALGLNRLFVIPVGSAATNGGYVRYPFEAMLAVTAQESAVNHCLVIGEDLGTIPEGVCETLNRWGIWSYRVAMFEREHADAFRQPEQFPENAIVTFNTHDLPTFAGWKSFYDLKVKAALGLDAGESEADRQRALDAMHTTLQQQGLSDLSLLDLLRYLARARSRLLAVSIEDILGVQDQPNIPGTTIEHPNWRRRLPVDLDALASNETLRSIAGIMAAEGRSLAQISVE
jgi:4-alpha-glucanotransferase